MRSVPLLPAALVCLVALAGCASGDEGEAGEGTFVLAVADSLAGGRLQLKAIFLHGGSEWVDAGAANGTSTPLTFEATGANVSVEGRVPAGDYDGVRILFGSLRVGERTAALAQSGIDLALNLSVADGGRSEVRLAFAWADALFESKDGLAFEPALSRVVVIVDGAETQRLEATAIQTGAGLAPVARMRIFDPTGLEAFASTFVADSPENPVVANAGELTLSATGSEALLPGARLTGYTWDIDGAALTGATIRHAVPVHGGNVTVRLTVEDSEGGMDSQTVHLAVKPGRAERSFNFTGSATGAFGNGAASHTFGPVQAAELDGAPARLIHLTAVLVPGASPVPVTDLDLEVRDGAGKGVGEASGSGSQHRIDQDITGTPGDGDWSVVVTPQQAYDAAYSVVVTLTWVGVNPEMDAFLSGYDDGHGHQH
ncbi:MAG TPA: hypothetical protein VM327_09405 [Candidatus Thermoplasmatota archaeon]|nr:hypothetical protein [Candidatus Thermoplasmatota archaeon]